MDLRARWYQPQTGQFLQRDPLEDATAQPYAYASDDPVNNSDPSGACTVQGVYLSLLTPGKGIFDNSPCTAEQEAGVFGGVVRKTLEHTLFGGSLLVHPLTMADTDCLYAQALCVSSLRDAVRHGFNAYGIASLPLGDEGEVDLGLVIVGEHEAGKSADAIVSELSQEAVGWSDLTAGKLVLRVATVLLGIVAAHLIPFFVVPGLRAALSPNYQIIGGYKVGSYTNLQGQGNPGDQRHHIIQDASMVLRRAGRIVRKVVSGYSTGSAPCILLNGDAKVVGTPHWYASQPQENPRAYGIVPTWGTYAVERRIAIKGLSLVGIGPLDVRRIMRYTDGYFNGIGVGNTTPATFLPANRAP